MSIQTHIATTLDATTPAKIRYDINVKEVLADVQILSRILKYTVEELHELSIDEIISCINKNDIEIGKTPVTPGLTNLGKVPGHITEDVVPNEGTIFFDIRFPIYYKGNSIKILINIEAQKSTDANKLGYHIENRIIYYLSRMISSQKDIEFFNSNYDDIKKVYSIWICMGATKTHDSIHEFVFTPRTIFGQKKTFPFIDKMRGAIINIRKPGNIKESKHKLISMLEDLLSNEQHSVKKQKLIEKHGIKMTVELERRIGDMCNLSDVCEERGLEKGIHALVKTLRELDKNNDFIISKIVENFSLSEQEAKEYL